MKKIFIYYSLSGNGDEVANYLKDKGYDIRKVETKKSFPKAMFLRILIGGYKAGIEYEDELKDFDFNIEEYEEIVIGSPVWNARLSSPINTVLKKLDLKGKKVRFILYSGSGTSPKATLKIKEKWPEAEIINMKGPKDNIEEMDKIKDI